MPSLDNTDRIATLEFFVGENAINNLQKHSAFASFYEEAAYLQAAEDEFCKIGVPVLGTHERVRELVQNLRDDPSCTKQILQQAICHNIAYPEDDVEHAVRTIIRMGFMLDCTLTKNFSRIYCLRNYVPQRWKLQDSFEDFIKSSIPRQVMGALAPYEYKGLISAIGLRNRCKTILQRTDNIADHLQYDPNSRTLKIFHQMDYLRAQLGRYPAPLIATTLGDNLKL